MKEFRFKVTSTIIIEAETEEEAEEIVNETTFNELDFELIEVREMG